MRVLGVRTLSIVAALWMAAITGCGAASEGAEAEEMKSITQEIQQCDFNNDPYCKVVGQVCIKCANICATPCDPVHPNCGPGKICIPNCYTLDPAYYCSFSYDSCDFCNQ